jgi:hypothetical protein
MAHADILRAFVVYGGEISLYLRILNMILNLILS